MKNKNCKERYVCKELSIISYIRLQRLRIESCLRMKDSSTDKKVYKGTPGGVRPRGSSKGRWRGSTLGDLSQLGISITHCQNPEEKQVKRSHMLLYASEEAVLKINFMSKEV